MADTAHVVVLGTTIGISVTGAAAARALKAAQACWPRDMFSVDTFEGDVHDRLQFRVDDDNQISTFLDRLSSRVTLAAIDARSTDLLMLHACGLADPKTGRVVACVAPSGTGKTTLARAGAGQLHYVTDETVAVDSEGGVVRYAKPLSIKQPGGAPKEQRNPADLGLTVAAEHGLRLGAVVVLERRLDAGSEPASELKPIPLFDAIVRLAHEVSYLPRLAAPLQRLARTIADVGGVQLLTYHSAEDVVPDLMALLDQEIDSTAGQAADAVLQASADELALWDSLLGVKTESIGRADQPTGDMIVDPSTGQALVLENQTLAVVSAVAAFVLRAVQCGLDETALETAVVQVFGPPPDAVSTRIAHVTEELRSAGLLVAD